MDSELGKRIEHWRLKCGLTQQNAAERIGMTRSGYSEIEDGKRQVTAEEIGKLAKLFQIGTDALIFGEAASEHDVYSTGASDLKNTLLKSLQGYLEVNLSRNEIIGDAVYLTGSGEPSAVGMNGSDGKRLTFDAFMQRWAERMLLSSPRLFLEKNNCNWLISCYRSGKNIADVICTSKSDDGSPKELRQTYYLSENAAGEIYAVCTVSEIPDPVFSKQFAEIAADLSESFEGIFYINLIDDSYVALKMKGAFYNIIQNVSGQDFFQSSLKHLRGVIHKEDYRLVADFIQKDHLLEKLKSGNITSTIFRLQINGTENFYRMRVSKSEYDNCHALMALENVSVFVNNEKIQNEKFLREKTIISILASEYSSIYYVDLTADTFETYKLGSADIPEFIFGSGLSYTDAYKKCVEEMVYESDQPEMLQAGSIYSILSRLKDRESFSMVYRSKRDAGATYCEMKIVRIENDSLPAHVVIGFADNSAEKSREIEKSKNISIMLQLVNNFEAVYDVDIKSGKFICYSDSELFSGESFFGETKNDDIFRGIAEAADRIVYVDDRPLVKTFLTRAYLVKELKKNQNFQMDFRLLIRGIPTWYHLKVVPNEGSNGKGLIAGIFDIEEQRQREYRQKSEMEKLTWEAQYDLLTGIRNKNAYLLFETEMNKTMQESDERFSVALFDINDLKSVNDRYGHEEGDRTIKKASGIICEMFKHSSVFKIGGDEFAVILKDGDYDKRKTLIETFRQSAVENAGTDGLVIASGISDRNENDSCLADVFSRADEEMYRNKRYLKSLF